MRVETSKTPAELIEEKDATIRRLIDAIRDLSRLDGLVGDACTRARLPKVYDQWSAAMWRAAEVTNPLIGLYYAPPWKPAETNP